MSASKALPNEVVMCSSAGKSPGLGKTGRGEMERRARALGCRGRMWGAWCGGASRWPCTRQGVLPQFPHPKLWLPLKMHWKPRSPPRVEGGMGRERTQVNNCLDTAQRCSRSLPAAGRGLTPSCAQLGAVSCREWVVFSWLDVALVCKTSCWPRW